MSKRKYEGGPTLVASKRAWFSEAVDGSLSSFSPSCSAAGCSSVLGKRSLEETTPVDSKRHQMSNKMLNMSTLDVFNSSHVHTKEQMANVGHKRAAEFDFEINRLHKRLKASTPTAEEAISFLLPHLIEMRRLYLNEREKASALLSDYNMQKRNNVIITRTLREQMVEKNKIQRQLDLALYRLALVKETTPFQ